MEAIWQIGNLPATDQARTLAQCRADFTVDAVQPLAVDQRTHFHIGLRNRVAIKGRAHGRRDALDELIRHFALDVHPLGAVAHLTAVDDARIANGFNCQIQIGVRQHNGWRLAAQFQIELGDVRRSGGHDP
ncbi:hypothetical protein D3C71_1815420 [compost metagenome]